jgi:hypothetical protein
VHADVSAAGLDVTFERRLLGCIEHVTGGVQKHDRGVLSEVDVREVTCVLGGIDGEIVRYPELLDGCDAVGDGCVSETGRFGEHEHLESRRATL